MPKKDDNFYTVHVFVYTVCIYYRAQDQSDFCSVLIVHVLCCHYYSQDDAHTHCNKVQQKTDEDNGEVVLDCGKIMKCIE